jgi:hypothetical protein
LEGVPVELIVGTREGNTDVVMVGTPVALSETDGIAYGEGLGAVEGTEIRGTDGTAVGRNVGSKVG